MPAANEADERRREVLRDAMPMLTAASPGTAQWDPDRSSIRICLRPSPLRSSLPDRVLVNRGTEESYKGALGYDGSSGVEISMRHKEPLSGASLGTERNR